MRRTESLSPSPFRPRHRLAMLEGQEKEEVRRRAPFPLERCADHRLDQGSYQFP